MKVHLEGKALENFCSSRYVNLITEEWEKIK